MPLWYSFYVKVLLVAINAKFIQTNLAVRLLAGYAEAHALVVQEGLCSVEFVEWNINQHVSSMLRGVFEAKPTVVLFSVYIWNRKEVFSLAAEVKKLMPEVLIGFGGPEVSFDAQRVFIECPYVDLLLSGEGEETFAELLDCLVKGSVLENIRGLYSRKEGLSEFYWPGSRPPLENLDSIPFPYKKGNPGFDVQNRLVYYESSRGCPFSCAYCLSAIDTSVRYYSLSRVLTEIQFFLDEEYPLVKFVDRTFNLIPERYVAIWEYIRDHYNGKTTFHFEIAGEHLGEEVFSVLDTMPEGALQFEIGIQSTNEETLRLVGRPSNPEKLAEKIQRIPVSIHMHVDLIAGLPKEDLATFAKSFDYAWALKAEMLQLGFLKILSGTPMEVQARKSPGYLWSDSPPYEVLASPVLPYADILVLKDVEHLLDAWFNSGLMRNTLLYLSLSCFNDSGYALFVSLVAHTKTYFIDGDLYLPRRSQDSFACLASFCVDRDSSALEYLKYDYLFQGKPGVFPSWYKRCYSKEAHNTALQKRGLVFERGESRRLLYARTEYEELALSPEFEKRGYFFEYVMRNKKDKKIIVTQM